jgi:hypothetical protein
MPLDRASILAITPSLPREEVQVPEWGGTVFVKTMSGTERDRFETLLVENKRRNFRGTLAALTVCDEAGKRLFAESDAQALSEHAASALERIATVAIKLNKFTDNDVRELEKNSESGPSDEAS